MIENLVKIASTLLSDYLIILVESAHFKENTLSHPNLSVLKRTDFNAIENNPQITKQPNEHWQSRSRMNVRL
jgi:hypothetical protein